jgi:hypothetical protein
VLFSFLVRSAWDTNINVGLRFCSTLHLCIFCALFLLLFRYANTSLVHTLIENVLKCVWGQFGPVKNLFWILFNTLYRRRRDSSVCIATGYVLNDWEVEDLVPVGSRIFSHPRRPDRFWGPPSLLSNGYRGLFPRKQSRRGVKLTTHIQLVPR